MATLTKFHLVEWNRKQNGKTKSKTITVNQFIMPASLTIIPSNCLAYSIAAKRTSDFYTCIHIYMSLRFYLKEDLIDFFIFKNCSPIPSPEVLQYLTLLNGDCILHIL